MARAGLGAREGSEVVTWTLPEPKRWQIARCSNCGKSGAASWQTRAEFRVAAFQFGFKRALECGFCHDCHRLLDPHCKVHEPIRTPRKDWRNRKATTLALNHANRTVGS